METLANVVYDMAPDEYLNALPAYDTCPGNSNRLNQLRKITDSFNYAPYTLAFPFGPTTGLVFGALATKEGSLQIPVGSFLLGISGFCTTTTMPGGEGSGSFRYSVTDKGSGLGLTERGFIPYRNQSGGSFGAAPVNGPINISGNFQQYFRAGIAQVYWLDAPLVITSPGQVQVAMSNLGNSSLTAQIAMHFAYPVNNVSVNTPTIRPVR